MPRRGLTQDPALPRPRPPSPGCAALPPSVVAVVAGVLAVVAVVVVGLPSPRRWWSGPPHGEVVGAPPLVVVGGGPAVVMVVGPEVEGGP